MGQFVNHNPVSCHLFTTIQCPIISRPRCLLTTAALPRLSSMTSSWPAYLFTLLPPHPSMNRPQTTLLTSSVTHHYWLVPYLSTSFAHLPPHPAMTCFCLTYITLPNPRWWGASQPASQSKQPHLNSSTHHHHHQDIYHLLRALPFVRARRYIIMIIQKTKKDEKKEKNRKKY